MSMPPPGDPAWSSPPPPPPPPAQLPPSPGPAGYYPPGHPPVAPQLSEAGGKKLAAGLCGILIGSLGIHKFVLGYTTAGLIMLLGSLLTCGLAAPVFSLIGIIEGIFYLTKSDAEFYQVYMVNKKEWF